MIATLTTFLLVALGPPESLQTARPQLPPKLRSPEEILADYATAIGGVEAWSKHKSLHTKLKLEVKGMQIGGTEERWMTAAGKMLSVTTIAGLGNFRQGTDGKVAWAEDPVYGLRLLEGAEAEESKVETSWNSDLNTLKLYDKVKAVPPPEPAPAGKRYECLELSLKVAKPSITCFDADSHLRVYQKGIRKGPQGDVPYRIVVTDWGTIKGMKFPQSLEMSLGTTMTLLVKMQDVKLDEKIDPKLFTVPKAARAAASAKKN